MLQAAAPDEARLRRLAGGSTWVRAEELWRRGRVVSIEATPDGVAGNVLGTHLYRTRVRVAGNQIYTECTCPMQMFCKHGLAMALHWARSPERVTSRPAPDDESAGGFASRDEVRAWAREHQVEHALRLPVEAAAELAQPQYRYELAYRAAHLTLEAAACAEVERTIPQHLARPLAEAARARLAAEARSVAEGLAEEEARALAAPSPEVEPLWRWLLEVRGTQRELAVPRGRRRRRVGMWMFRPAELQISWLDPDHRLRYVAGRPVTLAFVNDRPVLACPCDAVEACTHRLALIDETLDVLADPEKRSVAIQATRELTRPGWSRVLEVLEQVSAPATPAPVVEVWWQLDPEESTFDIVPVVRKLSKRGKLSSGARTTAERLLLDHADLDARDREVAQLLAGFHASGVRRDSYPHRALAALVGHPRVRGARGEPVAVRSATLGLAARRAGDRIRLEPTVDGERIDPRLLAALFATFAPDEPLARFDGDRCVVIGVDRRTRAICERVVAHGDTFPPEVHEQLLDAITKLDGRLPVAVPAELKGVEHALAPAVVIRARLVDGGDRAASLELEALLRPAPGAPVFPPGAGRRDVLVMRDGVRGYVRRRLDDEHAVLRAALARLPLAGAEEGPPNCFQIRAVDAALDVVAALEKPPPGIEAQWVDERPRVIARSAAKSLRLAIERERDWFGIAGGLKIEEGRLELAVLLDAMRRQQRYVRVGPASWLELGDELRAKLVPLADHTFATGDRLELSLGAVPAIRELIDAGAEVEAAPAWTLAADRLLAAQRLSPKPPRALREIMRPYQIEGHAWLTRIAAWGAGACLADDMGLGKTLQAIAVLVDRAKLGPALVLAPTSVTPNWVAELARFAPKLRPVLLTETDDRAARLATLAPGDVVIVSYGLLIREIERLADLRFATLVIDEAQALKNTETRRARAARRLDAELRVALTGTPLENHLGELWSIFSIVFPGLLGSWEQFRERYALPIERGAASVDPELQLAGEHARAALARVLRPFLLRRTKGEVARELPARVEIEVGVDMSDDERELYEDARLAAVAQLTTQGKSVRDEQHRFQVLAALTRLRLLASHPRLHDSTSTVPSSKLQRLLELAEELRAGGHRALVFSQFTKHLALAREALDRAGFVSLELDGGTPTAERARRIAAFQAGQADLFLISLKAGGTGINLTAADYVIHLDPWWNPAVEDQATDRAHRIGQTRPVTVYRLITKGTVEEKIVAMHARKRKLVSHVLDGTGAAAKLSTADLLALLAER